jgi:hypothetical protein
VQILGVIEMHGTRNVSLRVALAPRNQLRARRAVRRAARVDQA